MERLYAGFELDQPNVSVSMTINGPAPIILAMYVAAAKRRFGPDVMPARLRGTIQADILKEAQAQNEMIFPLEASLRFLADMVDYTTQAHAEVVSGVDQRLPYRRGRAPRPYSKRPTHFPMGLLTSSNSSDRGMDVNKFGPRLSFFLDCGLDIEYVVPRAGLPADLGHRHERCLRRGPARANLQAPHADQRPVADRRTSSRTTSRARRWSSCSLA